MKTIFRIAILLFFVQSHAQVGINTTTPAAQLEIKASSQAAPTNTDGIIIPRVDAFPLTNPTVAQQGMMVYLMVTSGANLPGFYYWDNTTTSWVGISSSANGDKDWYKVGTTTAPSAITDDMFHSGKVGIGNSNPFSKLHVMNNSSGMTPNGESVATLENNINTFLNILSPLATGVLFGANGDSTNGGIIYNPSYALNSMIFRTNGNVNRMVISDTGNIALGSFYPEHPLQFTGNLGDKISIYGGTGPHYGIGLQSGLMQLHTWGISDDIAFGYGSSAAFTERMRIKGNGNVGIGTTTPDYPLQFASAVGDKISLFGGTGNHYGFGIQGSLLQIHSSTIASDVAFGYGSSAAFTENVRFKGNGNVGIKNSNPNFPLHFNDNLGDKISLYGASGSHFGFGVQTNLFQIHASNNSDDIAFGYGTSASFTENVRFKGNGNVGIGVIVPDHPLQFKSAVGDKISLYGGAGAHYGFGIQNFTMQIHSAGVTDDIAFGYGSSGAFTENMRIKGDGNVGIGTPTPTAELEVNGFTKLGSTAPAIKVIKLTGTTGAAQGNTTFMAHGLTSSKILAVNILVEYAAGSSVPPSYNGSAGFEYDYYINGANIAVWTKSANSASILSKPIRVLVTYEE